MPRFRPGILNLVFDRLGKVEREYVLDTVKAMRTCFARLDMGPESLSGQFTGLATNLTGIILASGVKHSTAAAVHETVRMGAAAEYMAGSDRSSKKTSIVTLRFGPL